jgi:hypothetical protein
LTKRVGKNDIVLPAFIQRCGRKWREMARRTSTVRLKSKRCGSLATAFPWPVAKLHPGAFGAQESDTMVLKDLASQPRSEQCYDRADSLQPVISQIEAAS